MAGNVKSKGAVVSDVKTKENQSQNSEQNTEKEEYFTDLNIYGMITVPAFWIPVVFMVPAMIAVGTVMLCYYLTMVRYRRFPEWFVTPPISLLGAEYPESMVYRVGFGLCGLSVVFFARAFERDLLPFIGYGRSKSEGNSTSDSELWHSQSTAMRWSLYACCVGVTGQGVINIGSEVTEMFGDSNNNANLEHSSQSIIHQLLALVFFIGAFYHGLLGVKSYLAMRKGSLLKPISSWSVGFKIVSMLLPFVYQLSSMVLHPIFFRGTQTESSAAKDGGSVEQRIEQQRRDFNQGGISQWLTVCGYLLFFASYAYDYCWLRNEYQNNQLRRFKMD